jgi:hypothetical protein
MKEGKIKKKEIGKGENILLILYLVSISKV